MRVTSPRQQFYAVVNSAMDDFNEHGFDSQARLDKWLDAIRVAARAALIPEAQLNQLVRASLMKSFTRSLSKTRLQRAHPGLSQFTIESIKPKLRGELDRRIMASANLIKLNRTASIEKTLQRFSGWATSIPIGGSNVSDIDETRRIRKGIAGLSFEDRRVSIDQGHKLNAAINDIIATDGGAIAYRWKHVNEANYDARPEHEARDDEIFVIRGNWAITAGLMKLAGRKYSDQIDAPAQKPFCRCTAVYVYSVGDLPRDMLTEKGAESLRIARAAITRANHRFVAYG